MKMIVAIIRPEKLEAVQAALNERDVYLMTVSDVRGCGRQRGYTEVYRGTEFQVRLLPKLKLEIAVNDAFVEATIEAIVHAARTPETGQIGDGKIFVLPLEDCVRIRTGERGPRGDRPVRLAGMPKAAWMRGCMGDRQTRQLSWAHVNPREPGTRPGSRSDRTPL